MLSEYLLLFIHMYLNFKIFGRIFFHLFNFIQSRIVTAALEKTTWGKGLQRGYCVFLQVSLSVDHQIF